jgi:hypothetical protein
MSKPFEVTIENSIAHIIFNNPEKEKCSNARILDSLS